MQFRRQPRKLPIAADPKRLGARIGMTSVLHCRRSNRSGVLWRNGWLGAMTDNRRVWYGRVQAYGVFHIHR